MNGYRSNPVGATLLTGAPRAFGKDGLVVPTDAYGNKRYDKLQFKVEGTKVYQTDLYGRVGQQKFEIKNEKSRSK